MHLAPAQVEVDLRVGGTSVERLADGAEGEGGRRSAVLTL
jgi:hypothetical protein